VLAVRRLAGVEDSQCARSELRSREDPLLGDGLMLRMDVLEGFLAQVIFERPVD